jgi:hypothetical protein
VEALLSREHFTVEPPPDGGRNASRDFHGEQRTNASHASTADPDARLFRKGHGKEARLCFMGHVLMENRHGLVVEAELTRTAGFAERLAAVELVAGRAGRRPITVGADRAYDAAEFVAELRELGATPHVAQNTARRRSAIDRRTTRHTGYRLSQRARPNRGGVRLGQDHRRAAPDQIPRSRPSALALHPRHRGLQPDPPAQTPGNTAVTLRGRPPLYPLGADTVRSRPARLGATAPLARSYPRNHPILQIE